MILGFTLNHGPATQKFWGAEFKAQVQIHLSPKALKVVLLVNNLGKTELQFSGALHTYLAVSDISTTTLRGLQGQSEWDAVRDAHSEAADALTFNGEFDRVYAASPKPLVLQDGARVLEISQSPSWAQTVVWNPGETLCATLADMPTDGFAHMLCVEAAQVFSPIHVPAHGHWQGWQSLTLQ
jgi:glucose-6-phosphate 1-epimerase